MKRFLAVLLCTCASPAVALDACKPSPDDAQMRVCAYKPTQRYRVTGIVGVPTNLVFDATDKIKRMEWGYGGVDKDGKPVATWRGPKIRGSDQQGDGMPGDAFQNNLPIWPMAAGRSHLLVVTTTAKGEERAYPFELIARDRVDDCADSTAAGCSGDTLTTLSVAFTYPAEAKAAAVVAWQAKRAVVSQKAAEDRLETDPLMGVRNWKYQAHGDVKNNSELIPADISDNGWLTAMRWPENIQAPGVYILDIKTGAEQIAPTYTRPDGIRVMTTTTEWIRLRRGDKQVMDIHNLAWSPERPSPKTGTTSPDVVRQVLAR